MYVYQDPKRLERYDTEHSMDENRWIVIGSAHGHVLFVVEAETTDPDTVRIVSARKATQKEREEYEYSKL
ncbi:MAG: BrnT family toxin [Spirochaetaceae bacterium]|nr:BrnT family toxin [Spirochaetaceae bacterium]